MLFSSRTHARTRRQHWPTDRPTDRNEWCTTTYSPYLPAAGDHQLPTDQRKNKTSKQHQQPTPTPTPTPKKKQSQGTIMHNALCTRQKSEDRRQKSEDRKPEDTRHEQQIDHKQLDRTRLDKPEIFAKSTFISIQDNQDQCWFPSIINRSSSVSVS